MESQRTSQRCSAGASFVLIRIFVLVLPLVRLMTEAELGVLDFTGGGEIQLVAQDLIIGNVKAEY